MPFVLALAVLAASAVMLKLGALVVMVRVLWLALIAVACLAVTLAILLLITRRRSH